MQSLRSTSVNERGPASVVMSDLGSGHHLRRFPSMRESRLRRAPRRPFPDSSAGLPSALIRRIAAPSGVSVVQDQSVSARAAVAIAETPGRGREVDRVDLSAPGEEEIVAVGVALDQAACRSGVSACRWQSGASRSVPPIGAGGR